MFGHLMKHLSRTYIKATNPFCFKQWISILFQLKPLDYSRVSGIVHLYQLSRDKNRKIMYLFLKHYNATQIIKCTSGK